MGLRRLPKISAQTLSADADTPVYMTFCYIVAGVYSPVLANIYAHHVIDIWLEEVVKSHCAGEVAWFRYADDRVPRAQAVA